MSKQGYLRVILLMMVVLPNPHLEAQQSRLRQSMFHLSQQIATKMEKRTRIAVLDFNSLDGTSSPLGQYVSESLITNLFDTGKFQLVERRMLATLLKEYKLQSTGVIDSTTMKKLGQVLGVDAIVTGTITDLAAHVSINARLVATDTALVFATASEEIEKDEDVRSLMGVQAQPSPTQPQSSLPKKNDDTTPRKFLGEGQLEIISSSAARYDGTKYVVENITATKHSTKIHMTITCEQYQCQVWSLRGGGMMARGDRLRLAFIIDDHGNRFECTDDLGRYTGNSLDFGPFNLLAQGEILGLDLMFRSVDVGAKNLKVHYSDGRIPDLVLNVELAK